MQNNISFLRKFLVITFSFVAITSILFIIIYTSLSLKSPISSFMNYRSSLCTDESNTYLPSKEDTTSIKIIDEQSQVIDVVQKATPAVVSIVASAEVPVFDSFFYDPFFNSFFDLPSVEEDLTELRQIGAGTGFIVSSDGYIITNKHVVEEADASYTVYLTTHSDTEPEKIQARIVALHPDNDIAILKIDRTDLPFLSFGDSDNLQVGQTAITIGYALGEFANTVSKGVISGLSRTIIAGGYDTPTEELYNLIQTDAAINPGNSGGPMLDLGGNVIGINVAMASAENIGFAIPINEAQKAFDEVTQTGTIQKEQRAYLGIRYVIINEEIQAKNNLPHDYGALIARGESAADLAIVPGSPADLAGLVENDIILEINGEKITSRQKINTLIGTFAPGDTATLTVLHRGETQEKHVTFGETF